MAKRDSSCERSSERRVHVQRKSHVRWTLRYLVKQWIVLSIFSLWDGGHSCKAFMVRLPPTVKNENHIAVVDGSRGHDLLVPTNFLSPLTSLPLPSLALAPRSGSADVDESSTITDIFVEHNVSIDKDLAHDIVVPSSSCNSVLLDRLRRNDTTPIILEGYVIAKRSFGKHLLFLDFETKTSLDFEKYNSTGTDVEDSREDTECENIWSAMLLQDFFKGKFYSGYRRCLLRGAKLRVTGVSTSTRNPGNGVLNIQSIELLGMPRQPQHIEIILRQCWEGNIPLEEVSAACGIDNPDELFAPPKVTITNFKPRKGTRLATAATTAAATTVSTAKATQKNWLGNLAKEIFSNLPADPYYPAAADQTVTSKKGGFKLPKAPSELLKLPPDIVNKSILNRDDINGNGDDVIEYRHYDSVQSILSDHGAASRNETISVQGWIQNRRRFDDNITFVALVDELSLAPVSAEQARRNADDASRRLRCLVHPDLVKAAGMYRNILSVETKVRIQGIITNGPEKKRDAPNVVWVNHIELLRATSRSVTIRYILDMLYEGRIDAEEVAQALLMSYQEAVTISVADATTRRWKANQLAVLLQEKSGEKRSSVGPELLTVMQRYKHYSQLYPVIPTDISPSDASHNLPMDPPQPIRLLMTSSGAKKSVTDGKRPTIATGMPGSKWESKKKPQLEWMRRQIRHVLESHPDFGKRKLNIVDIGGGKGSLANYLGRSFDDDLIHIHVLDICEGAIVNGEQRARRFNLPVEFTLADASQASAMDDIEADVVIALHACGHLSDVALAHAVQHQAGFVIVPCCFNSNPQLEIPIYSQYLHRDDGLEVGNDKEKRNLNQSLAVPDWLGIPADDWSSLKLLAEVQGDITLANEAIGILCAVRAAAALRHADGQQQVKSSSLSIDGDDKIQILRFPIEYSTRNTVLVRTCPPRQKTMVLEKK